LSFIVWSDKYLVNIPEIDADHRNLFALANRLHDHVAEGSSTKAIAHALRSLVRYVHEHFDREERLMAHCRYPGYVEHCKTHRMLEQIVNSMQRVYSVEPSAVDPAKLVEFMGDWLSGHIIGNDLKYAPYVHKRAHDGDDSFLWLEDTGSADGDAEPGTRISVVVPAAKISVIEECARLLREHDWRAEAIENITQRSHTPELEEAKKIAHAVLR
jgi:hemerythrin